MTGWTRLLVIAVVVILPCPALAVTDCSRPKTKIDWLMCSNDRLQFADALMAAAFRDAFNRTEDREALLEDQARWRTTVRDACNDVPCLMKAFEDRASALETY